MPIADVEKLPMPMKDVMPMMVKEDMEVIGRTLVVCRSPRTDKLLFSIIVRVYFMYEFCLVWN